MPVAASRADLVDAGSGSQKSSTARDNSTTDGSSRSCRFRCLSDRAVGIASQSSSSAGYTIACHVVNQA
ncbi:hypothetical protein TgHK011_009979 [Trichoderma gracile]|nr:hypothetical protein TgHK011_009979 [Trichoderma gracile]